MGEGPEAVLARARALIGVRFRPQGHSPEIGLDCVGLVLATFAVSTEAVRRNYRRRGVGVVTVINEIPDALRRVSRTKQRPADLLVLRVSPDQVHLAIHTGAGFIHADGAIGRVTEVPGAPAWPVAAVYRLRCRRQQRRV